MVGGSFLVFFFYFRTLFHSLTLHKYEWLSECSDGQNVNVLSLCFLFLSLRLFVEFIELNFYLRRFCSRWVIGSAKKWLQQNTQNELSRRFDMNKNKINYFIKYLKAKSGEHSNIWAIGHSRAQTIVVYIAFSVHDTKLGTWNCCASRCYPLSILVMFGSHLQFELDAWYTHWAKYFEIHEIHEIHSHSANHWCVLI